MITAIDMCVVPTLIFDLLFAFVVLGHGPRQLLWFEATRHPTAEWLARQITEVFSWTSAPGLPGARQWPSLWADLSVTGEGDGYSRLADLSWIAVAERNCGTPLSSLCRECLGQMAIFGEAHLRRILSAYAAYYNQARTHLALEKDAPLHRRVQRSGAIFVILILAGLHHQYGASGQA